MELATDTEATLYEIDKFYRQLDYKLNRTQGLLGYSPIFESQAPQMDHKVNVRGDKRLFNTVTGFFDEVPEPGYVIGLPADLFEFYEHVDMEKVQDDVVRMIAIVGGRSSIRQVASGLDFGNPKKTVALVFMTCLFLEIDKKLQLNQGLGDVFISTFSFGN